MKHGWVQVFLVLRKPTLFGLAFQKEYFPSKPDQQVNRVLYLPHISANVV